jgi:hypothetical protein
MPDLDELAGFDPGTPTRMLPPSEVRRRGDRRRRTTTLVVAGAALAAAVAVGTPVALLAGPADRGQVHPMPSPPVPTPAPGWVTTVPADFPLTAGFPDEDATPGSGLSADPNMAPVCDGAGVEGFVDDRVVTYSGESEDRAVRVLALYPDGAAARAQLASLRTAINGCGPAPIADGTTAVYAPVPADLGTEESFAYTQQVRHDDGLLSDLTYVQVARTGNALYLESSYGAAGGDQVVAAEAERLLEGATAPLQEMCRFAEHPCQVEGEPAAGSSTEAGSADDIPAEFPLDVGFGTGSDVSVTGPSSSADGVSFADLCQTDAWPGSGGTDRLAVRLEGIEYSVTRELVTYGSAQEASAVVTALSDAVAACPRDEDRRFRTLEANTGYPSSVTFGFTYEQGLGGAVHQVVRVGRAVLATVETGEYAPESLAAGVQSLTGDNREITDLMRCSWTEAGC